MCKVYNPVGALTTVKNKLLENNITEFSSLKELIEFQNEHNSIRLKIRSKHELLINQEKVTLQNSIREINKKIEIVKHNTRLHLYKAAKKLYLRSVKQTRDNIKYQTSISLKIKSCYYHSIYFLTLSYYKSQNYVATKRLHNTHTNLSIRLHHITNQFDNAVKHSSQNDISELERKITVINKLHTHITGAIGEHQVVKTLEKLPDSFYLINDYSVSISQSVKGKHRKRKSTPYQIDHILVGPPGIFLLETKNWSKDAINNPTLRSPVQQINRLNKALYNIINKASNLKLNNHFWGKKTIPIKNLIVFINNKPSETFEFIKILNLNELLEYINYQKDTLSVSEVETIANYLLNSNHNCIRL